MNFSVLASEGTFSAMAMQMFLFSASLWNTSMPDSPAEKNGEKNKEKQLYKS